jgi:hypothetical protein
MKNVYCSLRKKKETFLGVRASPADYPYPIAKYFLFPLPIATFSFLVITAAADYQNPYR